ncbi:MAG: sigma-70 family RNA polymerase sigma factor [Planctomycetes bacterium]|nr:sigma-70 family RNA polymerase sigma factor [Planctomycetota bacterium]
MMSTTVASSRDIDVRAFVQRHQRGLQRWLRALGCESGAAEEHCQDALLAALHRGIDARPPGVASAWLRTTARNLFWMRLRHERRQPPVRSLDEIEAAWQAVGGDRDDGDAARTALRDCLDAADARDRELLEARYRDGRSRAVMAASLGIGEAGVKQALRRARSRVQQCVEGKLGGQP